MQPRRMKRQRKNKRDEAVNISNSDSTTNKTMVQFTASPGHLPARRQLMRNPLRFSKRLLEREATSQPKMPAGHSSTIDDIQIFDVQPQFWDCSLLAIRQINPNPLRTLTSSGRLLEMGATSQPNTTIPLRIQRSESWDCPVSVKRKVNLNTRMISDRRCNLRSYKRPIEETGTASLPRSSRECSSSPDDNQQPDDQADTINSAYQVLEEGFDQVESPSSSLKLTEMVDMWEQQADDGINSEMRSWPEETTNGYQVKQEFMPILAKIISKHGDIAVNCLTKSVKGRSVLLEVVCGIISDFKDKNLCNINEGVLEDSIRRVGGIKDMKVEVDWLHMRLIEVRDAKDIHKYSAVLKEKTDSNRKLIEESENALEKCKARKKEVSKMLQEICDEETACEERLTRAKVESATTSITVGYAKSKVKRFLNCSVVNDLI